MQCGSDRGAAETKPPRVRVTQLTGSARLKMPGRASTSSRPWFGGARWCPSFLSAAFDADRATARLIGNCNGCGFIACDTSEGLFFDAWPYLSLLSLAHAPAVL